MPVFKGQYEETFTLDVSIEKAKELFGDLDSIIANYVGLEKGDKLDDKTIHFQLEPKSAMGATFKGDYKCEYNFSNDTRLEWHSVGSGNMEAKGTIDFKSLGDNRTHLSYRQNMTCDIPVNRFLGKALAPIVERSISGGIKEYVDRLKKKAR